MISKIVECVTANETLVSLGISAFDVIITTILTALIIIQTSRINRKQQKAEEKSAKQQQEFEEKLNQQQIELQKRQIQVESFPYKRELYANTFAVFEFCHAFQTTAEAAHLSQKTGKDIREAYGILCEQYVPDVKGTIWSLWEAQYILPPEIAKVLLNIRSDFDQICSSLTVLETLERIMTEAELRDNFQGVKESNIENALQKCKSILSYMDYIEKALLTELNISGLSK